MEQKIVRILASIRIRAQLIIQGVDVLVGKQQLKSLDVNLKHLMTHIKELQDASANTEGK